MVGIKLNAFSEMLLCLQAISTVQLNDSLQVANIWIVGSTRKLIENFRSLISVSSLC